LDVVTSVLMGLIVKMVQSCLPRMGGGPLSWRGMFSILVLDLRAVIAHYLVHAHLVTLG